MVLKIIEFDECYHDTPSFREKLQAYEKEIENTSESIKGMVKEVKKVIAATKEYSKAQINFADALEGFKLEHIGELSRKEITIIESLQEFARYIRSIEEQRHCLLDNINIRVVDGLDHFRKSCLSPLKEQKRQFERNTDQYYKQMENRAALTTKKKDQVLLELDKEWEKQRESFVSSGFKYVSDLQAVHEKKGFECMEPILGLMRDTFTFYHQCHEESQNIYPLCQELQYSLQTTREAYEDTISKAHDHMLRVRDRKGTVAGFTRGYLYVSEKKKGTLGSWNRYFVEHFESFNELHISLFHPLTNKTFPIPEKDVTKLQKDTCVRCKTEIIERRFCFEVTTKDKRYYTFQANSNDQRKEWLDALGGKEPTYFPMELLPSEVTITPEMFRTVQRIMQILTERGLEEEEGIYRKSGSMAKITKVAKEFIDKNKIEKIDFSDQSEWDIHTLAVFLKYFLANSLPEPLLTFNHHGDFVACAKISNFSERSLQIQYLVRQLPQMNQDMLEMLIKHLRAIADNGNKNLMRASNLGVVFGPTLMRSRNETVQSIMNIKYQNAVVEHMIEDYQRIFHGCITNSTDPSTPMSTQKALNCKPSFTISPLTASMPAGPTNLGRIQSRYARQANTVYMDTVPDLLPSNRNSILPSRPPPAANLPISPISNKPTPPLASLKPRTYSIMIDDGQKQTKHPIASLPELSESVDYSPFKRKAAQKEKSYNYHTDKPSEEIYEDPAKSFSKFAGHKPLVEKKANHNNMNNSKFYTVPPGRVNQKKIETMMQILPPSVIEKENSETSQEMVNNKHIAMPDDSPTLSPPPIPTKPLSVHKHESTKGQKAKALYNCRAENPNELSFKKNDIFENVTTSGESQWLFAELNGESGLIPENYIEYIV